MKQPKFKTVEGYIASFPPATRSWLKTMRRIIKEAAPEAEELISYNIPAFRQNGMLVYYAGYKNHIGFYPTSSPIRHFAKQLMRYKTSKGAIQFPLGKKLPVALIKKIVRYKAAGNLTKAILKAERKR